MIYRINEEEGHLLRFLTPMLKKSTAEDAVYSVRESMELMGGIGYIEDTIIPKIMRDVMVLPIWEGAGNIMILDMLRAMGKSLGMKVLFKEMEQSIQRSEHASKSIVQGKIKELRSLFEQLAKQPREIAERSAKYLFDELTITYKVCLMLATQRETNEDWILPAIDYYLTKLIPKQDLFKPAPDVQLIHHLIAWEIKK